MISPRFGIAEVVDEAVREHAVAEVRLAAAAPGRAQCSVGSIDDDGMRYGLTTHALSANTITIAPAIVKTQSSTTRTSRGRLREQPAERVSHRTCSRRQASIFAWSPESSTSGTLQPRNSAGRV